MPPLVLSFLGLLVMCAGAWYDGVFTSLPGMAPALTLIVRAMLVLTLGLVAWLLLWHWRETQRHEAERRVQERLDREWDPVWWEERQARRAREAQLVVAELAQMRRATWVGRLLARGRRTDETPA